jgi:hypothetical protein
VKTSLSPAVMLVVLSMKLKKQGFNELCIILHKYYNICNLVWNSNQFLIRNLYDYTFFLFQYFSQCAIIMN